MSLTESIGGKLANAVSQPAWVTSPVRAIFVMMNSALVQITLVGPAWKENFQIRLDLAPSWLRDIEVADKDPNSWVPSLVITLVLDGVRRVVCVYYPSTGSGRYVCLKVFDIRTYWCALAFIAIYFTLAIRCLPVRAEAIIFTEASWFEVIIPGSIPCVLSNNKALGTGLLEVISWTNLIIALTSRIFMQVPPAHQVA